MGTRIWCPAVSSTWDFYTFPLFCGGCKWLLWESWSSTHLVGVCQLGRALLRSSCCNLPFGPMVGTRTPPQMSVRRDVTTAPSRHHLGSLQQQLCCPPFPTHPLWPQMAQNEKLRKPRSWEWIMKHMGADAVLMSVTTFCSPLEKRKSLEAFLYSPLSVSSSPFNGSILISIAPLLSAVLVCFLLCN